MGTTRKWLIDDKMNLVSVFKAYIRKINERHFLKAFPFSALGIDPGPRRLIQNELYGTSNQVGKLVTCYKKK